MHSDHAHHPPTEHAVEVHRPIPLPPPVVQPVPVVQGQPNAVPAVASVVLPDGRVVTGYAVDPARPEPVTAKPAVSRAAVNVAVGGVGFLAVCGGLLLLTSFITALTALVTQLVILATVITGGWIAVRVLSPSGGKGGNTVNICKATFKRNHFRG
ncbi:hypothetical protein [Streptomyces sp. enrichment culture]|uniref:hypothetical protein n=1 Tax=Streptomyces sp. enrichment culture TaxID=1795815 RepID=UPI003F570F29